MTSRLIRVTIPDPANPRPLGAEPRQRVLLGRAGVRPCRRPLNSLDCIPSDGASHSVGTVRVDPRDGTLWLSSGDGADDIHVDPASLRAENPQSLAGKVLHIARDGRGLPRHPFCRRDHNLRHVCTKIAAIGFRQPFRFSLDPAAGTLFVGDVGLHTNEEIDRLVAGGDYGWPCYEGARRNGGPYRTPGFGRLRACRRRYGKRRGRRPIAPVLTLPYAGQPAAVIGGPRYRDGAYPPPYRGSVFFGDFERETLSYVRLAGRGRPAGPPQTFGTRWDGVDLQQAPDGNLVYVDLGNHTVTEVVYAPGRAGPVATPTAAPTQGAIPLTVQFLAHASAPGRAPQCVWRFGDGDGGSRCDIRHTYRARPPHGSYVARVFVTDGFKSREYFLRVTPR
jgi:glucose/sorbosone dehydrogenase/PKD domain-containing protein